MNRKKAISVATSALCFRQRVDLPSAQVRGLADAELAAALVFEVEPFSGIAACDGEVAWRRLDDGSGTRAQFDVVQMRRSDMAAEMAKARREHRRVTAFTAVPDAAIGESAENMPSITVRRSGNAGRVAWIWAIGMLMLLGAICFDAWELAGDGRRLGREVAVGRDLQRQRDALQARIDNAVREAQQLRMKRADLARAGQNVEVLRDAWRKLFAAIPVACADECVVKSVKAEGPYSCRLVGMALAPSSAARTLVRLAEELRPPRSVWELRPGRMTETASGAEFECVLEFDSGGQFR